MKLEVKVNFASMTDEEIVEFGLRAGKAHFDGLVALGAANGDSLFVQVGIMEHDEWHEIAVAAYGQDAGDFRQYVDPKTGKIATVVEFSMDSDAAYMEMDNEVGPEGPRRWTGGVFYEARAQLADGEWRTCHFVAAASGVQGSFDKNVIYTVLSTAGGAWELREKARDAAARRASA